MNIENLANILQSRNPLVSEGTLLRQLKDGYTHGEHRDPKPGDIDHQVLRPNHD